jgi:hypothetical protein
MDFRRVMRFRERVLTITTHLTKKTNITFTECGVHNDGSYGCDDGVQRSPSAAARSAATATLGCPSRASGPRPDDCGSLARPERAAERYSFASPPERRRQLSSA